MGRIDLLEEETRVLDDFLRAVAVDLGYAGADIVEFQLAADTFSALVDIGAWQIVTERAKAFLAG